ncbi:protein FAF-like, chloroplastic [Andrographis paniculata]|uniref:protein FAF-like, chloroplastic n=1 Tax=Andrographis paniculata TaxID=175694 RepID=UPI0021E99D85|nr:protein FAF-like, chloroplastic [Andrographis paniculata]
MATMKMIKSQSRIFGAPVEEEGMRKQGIVAILDSDGGERKQAASIRRTLSADMSSKKWLEQNGMKKVVSSEELAKLPLSVDSSSSSSEGEEEFEKVRRRLSEKPAPPLEDVWSSIMMSQKRKECPLPPPYVHPLVKRASSSLSEKSLEICTESLGSETGSDCFSAYCSSDEGKEGDDRIFEETNKVGEILCGAVKYKKSAAAVEPPPPPPPIHSISASIHMSSHRENGRLVVEAVSVPARNFFQAHRQNGRLVLSLMRTPSPDETADEEILEEEDAAAAGDGGCAEEEDPAEEDFQSLNSEAVVTKFMTIGNRNPKADNTACGGDEVEEEFTLPQSLPPRVSRLIRSPPTAASFNAYEYFWRNMATGAGYAVPNPINKRRHNGVNGEENNADYFGAYFSGCKEARTRRSLLIWEPYNCIAT